jgi:hypothetical protein
MKKIFLSVLAIALLTGCKEDEEDVTPVPSTDQTDATETDTVPVYSVPESYNFANVSYGGQTDRLDMLTALTAYVKTSHSGDKLDTLILDNMYANQNSPFTGQVGSSGKDLKSKTEEDARAEVVDLFRDMAANSGSLTSMASDGVAGLVVRKSGYILVDASGKEYAQLIDKGLMGSCFYYQGTTKYLADNEKGIGDAVDNEIIEAGKGTAKEHHFDEAFGYFGVQKDFPTNDSTLVFWGKYCNKRNVDLETNKIMDAFLKGRAAISAKDKKGQDAAVSDVKKLWEKAAAGTGIHYLNEAIAAADNGNKFHALTEGYAFIKALKYNMDASITPADVDEVIALIGENFWKVTAPDLEKARDLLAEKTGLTAEKASL